MKSETTLKQRVLNTFARRKNDRIVYSPRLYYWYFANNVFLKHSRHRKTLIPSKYLGKSQIDIYDDLEASPRYCEETLIFPLFEIKINPDVDINVLRESGAKSGESITIYKTPLGNLKQVESVGGGLGGHITEYPIKTVEDIKIMKFILENTEFFFLKENYELAERIFGSRGIVSTYLLKSPYQKILVEYMGFNRMILLLKRYPSQMENFLKFLEEWDNQMYNKITESPLAIVNFGENIDANLSPPAYFEKYLIPYYKKRVTQLHKAGKYCHIHIDGSLKDLLPYFSDLPFDGLEALTAKPQGDVSLEEIKDSIEDKILLDGIPSILFLQEYSNDYVLNYTQRVLEIFSPNLILGVSDELSPNGDIKKIEKIAELIKNFEF